MTMTDTTTRRSPARRPDLRIALDRHPVGRLAACAAALLVLAIASPPALADGEAEGPPEQPFEITQKVLDDSITTYVAPSSITSLGSTEPADDQVIVLEADILFASNTWDLPGSATARIAELAAEIPEGASVQVGGHTDSRPVNQALYDFDNQELSEHRAQAVADALTAQRPDLTLEVTGHGSQQLAANEDPDDPSSYAANRRVEMRYGD
ncbi:MAG: OmpA family protein [Brachybacterium sp.]|uniref:OmpA family protein n=1 Tax=Brachybacterium sp. TaxID=1891286 RepID=UPI003F91AC1A